MANNIGSIFFVVVLIVSVLTVYSFFGNEIQDKNQNLDAKSLDVLSNLTGVRTSYTNSNFTIEENNVTSNSTFADVDPFARQYLEDSSNIQQKKSTLEQILNMPDILLNTLGITQPAVLVSIKLFFGAILTFFIGLAIYKAIRIGEVD